MGSLMKPRRAMLVPPGGFAGFAQQTPATQYALSRGAAVIGGGRRRAPARRARAAPRSLMRVGGPGTTRRQLRGLPPIKRRSPGRARLVKGSAAAKRYMASIRRKRKR